jgi:hypothetical protein
MDAILLGARARALARQCKRALVGPADLVFVRHILVGSGTLLI